MGRVVFSGEFADFQVSELDGGAFGLKADVAVGGGGVFPAGDFGAVDPEADFAVGGADVVVVPLAGGLGGLGGGEAANAVRGGGWEGLEGGFPDGENIAVAGEPGGFLPGGFLVCSGEGEVEDLDFDAGVWEAGLGEEVEGGLRGPDEDAGVAGGFFVHPLGGELEVGVGFAGGEDADGEAGAGDGVGFIAEGPGVCSAVDGGEICFSEVGPAGFVAGRGGGGEVGEEKN